MLRTRLVGSTFAVVVALIVAVPLAHAGGGAGSSLPAGTTVCRAILNGANAGQVIHLQVPTDPALDQIVQVGSPVLQCELIPSIAVVERGPALQSASGSATVCYLTSGKNDQKLGAALSSAFSLSDDVELAGIGLVCVPGGLVAP